MARATKLVPSDSPTEGDATMHVSPVLVGRSHELTLLQEAVASPPVLILVAGESGIGKSRLVGELAQSQPSICIGRCHAVAEPFPLGPAVEALEGVLHRLHGIELPAVTGTLRRLIPELAEHLPPEPPDTNDRQFDRRRLHRAIRELLHALGPVTLVLEDLHWADDQTLELLQLLAEDMPDQLAIVLTARNEGAVDGVTTVIDHAAAPTTTLSLRGLTPGDIREMVASILGATQVSAEFADYLHERTGGLPFAVEEVLALLQTRRTLVRDESGWSRRDLSELGVPGPVRDAVIERVAQLEPDARAVTDAAAILGREAPAAIISTAAGLEAPAGAAALRSAAAAGILVAQRDRWGFRHILAAEAVAEHLSAMRRRELHSRAADALAAAATPPLGRIADHLAHAGRHAEWLDAAENAADDAARVGHDAEATRLLLELSRSDQEIPQDVRIRVAHKLGSTALQAMAQDRAIEVLEDTLAEGDLKRLDRGRLRQLLAGLWYQAGDYSKCHAQLVQSVPELEADLRAQIHAMGRLANVYVPGTPITVNERWADRAMAAAEHLGDPVMVAHSRARARAMWLASGHPRWRDALASRAVDQPRTDRLDHASYAHNLAVSATFAGAYRVAHEAVVDGMAIVTELGNERMVVGLQITKAVVDFHTGRWHELTDLDALLSPAADLPGHAVELRWLSGSLALAQGEFAHASTQLASALETVTKPAWFQIWLGAVAGSVTRLRLADGDVAGAAACAAAAMDVLRRMDLWAMTGPLTPWAAQAYTAGGDLQAAHTLVSDVAEGLRGRDAPVAETALLVAQGIIQQAEGAATGAAERYEAAADGYQQLGNTYEAILAAERLGNVLASGERVRAAMQSFNELGATWDAARCARNARTLGVGVPTPYRGGRRGYGDELSPREQQVAELAATGRTNRQIAAELQLSTTTVGKHLGRAMRKLGVSSRTAVAATLRGREDRDSG